MQTTIALCALCGLVIIGLALVARGTRAPRKWDSSRTDVAPVNNGTRAYTRAPLPARAPATTFDAIAARSRRAIREGDKRR